MMVARYETYFYRVLPGQTFAIQSPETVMQILRSGMKMKTEIHK